MLGFIDRDARTKEDIRLSVEKEQGGPAFTGVVGGKIIGCAGIMLLHQGVGSAWVTLSNGVLPHKIWMTRTIKRILYDVIRAHGLHRVEALVTEDQESHHQWIKALGFSPEGGRAKAMTSDKRDAIRYELVRL